jgi:hypothetical protein
MIILLLYLFTGWFLVSLTINLTNFIFSKLLRTVPSKLKILLILINGFFWIIIFSMIPYDLLNESMNVYCMDDTEEESDPYMVTVSSKHYNSSYSFDIRYLRDIGALGVISKTSVSVAKYVPSSHKAVATIGTAAALGTTYLGIKVMEHLENQNKIFTVTKNDKSANLIIEPNPELGGTEKDVEEVAKNISINSPYESSEILEGIKMILFCTEILSTLAIISFIFYSLFIYIKYVDSNKLKFKNKFTLKFINLVQKVSLVYTLFWGVLTLFNLSVILYLSIRLSNFLDTFTV